jgi:hypothetical protein
VQCRCDPRPAIADRIQRSPIAFGDRYKFNASGPDSTIASILTGSSPDTIDQPTNDRIFVLPQAVAGLDGLESA